VPRWRKRRRSEGGGRKEGEEERRELLLRMVELTQDSFGTLGDEGTAVPQYFVLHQGNCGRVGLAEACYYCDMDCNQTSGH